MVDDAITDSIIVAVYIEFDAVLHNIFPKTRTDSDQSEVAVYNLGILTQMLICM
jgi:hypothetical protein